MSNGEIISQKDFIVWMSEEVFSHEEVCDLVISNPYVDNRLRNAAFDPMAKKHVNLAERYRSQATEHLITKGYSSELSAKIVAYGLGRISEELTDAGQA